MASRIEDRYTRRVQKPPTPKKGPQDRLPRSTKPPEPESKTLPSYSDTFKRFIQQSAAAEAKMRDLANSIYGFAAYHNQYITYDMGRPMASTTSPQLTQYKGPWDQIDVNFENNAYRDEVTVHLQKRMTSLEWQKFADNGYNFSNPYVARPVRESTPPPPPAVDLMPSVDALTKKVNKLEKKVSQQADQLDECLTILRLLAAEAGL